MATQLTTETFAKSIQNGVSFIDFGAQWCPPCRMMEPVVEELSQDFDGKVTIAQVDVDQSQDLANLFGIRSIPTMVIFKDGNKLVQTMRRQAEQFGTEMTFGFVQKIEGEKSPFEVHLDNGEISHV